MIQIPIDLEVTSGATLQKRIFTSILRAILTQKLSSGTRLPSSRDFAQSLSVSRNTVVLAYNRLAAEGYIDLKRGVGAYVSHNLPEKCFQLGSDRQSPSILNDLKVRRCPDIAFVGVQPTIIEKGASLPSIDFWYGRASRRIFPIGTWRRYTTHNFGRAAANMVEYPPVAGLPELRGAIAEHLAASRGIKTDWRNIIITAGAQEAFDIIAKLFIRPGTRVAIESPCYQGIAFALRAHGAELVPIAVDERGMNVDELEQHSKIPLVCTTPSHQFPTGVTLALDRRLRMIQWAGRVGAYIVEDDYDGDFRYSGSPLPAMAGLQDGSESVIYVGTFSKTLGAGIRIGYLVIPNRISSAVISAKALTSQGHPWFSQVVLAEFLETGGYCRHLRELRQTQMRSRDALLASLAKHFGSVDLLGQEAGMHLLWRLPPKAPRADDLAFAARELDVGIYPPSAAGAEVFGETERSIILGYPALTEDQIAEGILRVRTAFKRLIA